MAAAKKLSKVKAQAQSPAAADAAKKSPAGGVSLVQRVKAMNKWRETLNPLRQLTVPRVVQLLEQYPRGIMADLQWTYFFVEQTDADLFALIERRSSRLLEMDYGFKAAKDADKTVAEKQAEALQKKFEQIDNLYEAIEHLAMASFRGYAHCEKWYEGNELTHLEIVDQWNVVRDGLRGDWKYNPEARAAAFESLPAENLITPENFVMREVRRPINRIALIKFLRSNLAEKDWDAIVEIVGIPTGVVVGPPNVPPGKEAEYESSAREIAEGGSGYLPNGSSYVANPAARTIWPFHERLEYLTEKLILAGTGGMLTMLAKSGSGTLAGNAHTDAFEQVVKGEARKVSEVINRQLVDDMLDELFPGQPHCAYFELAANEETKVGEVITHIKDLRAAGLAVDPAQVTEKTGYTVTPAAPLGGGGDGADPAAIENRRIRNRAGAAGRETVFMANAEAQTLAAKRPIFKPVAERLAALLAIADPEQFRAAAAQLKADSPALYKAVIDRAPELAKTTEEIIGTAFASGMAEHAEAAGKAARP